MTNKSNRGFTLIEVVVAFAVLAIISGTLLQIFVTATQVNQNAFEIDKASAIAVEAIERFKSVPGLPSETYIYYDQSWGTAGVTTANAVYVLKQTIPSTVTTSEGASFYPDVVKTINTTTDQALQITTGNTTTSAFHTLTIDDGVVRTELTQTNDFINVKNGKVGILVNALGSLKLTIKNNTQLTMGSAGEYSATGTPSTFQLAVYVSGLTTESQLTVNFSQGDYSTSLVNAQQITAANKQIGILVTRQKDNKVLVDMDGSKYDIEQK